MQNVIVRLRDLHNAASPEMLGNYQLTPEGLIQNDVPITEGKPLLDWQSPLSLGNRTWLIEIQAIDNYLTSQHLWRPRAVIITGMLFTVAFSLPIKSV